MPDPAHAANAKARAAQFASPAVKAAVDAKANRILQHGTHGTVSHQQPGHMRHFGGKG